MTNFVRELLITAVLACPIAAPAQPAFDAASIRPAAPRTAAEAEGGGNRSRIEYSPTSLTMRNVDLTECIQWAYGVAFYQIAGSKIAADSYDILAKPGSPVPVEQLRAMLRNLLANRFGLTLHREAKALPVYELVVAKGGPKLPAPNPPGIGHAAESLPRRQNDSFVFQDSSLAEFAEKLSMLRGIDLPVVDHTGISGTYDLVLKSVAAANRDGDSPTLFSMVQEQLGLRLSPAKSKLDVLVIDHSEKPSAN